MDRDQRRRRFAQLFLRFRRQWHVYARNAISKQVRSERTVIHQAFSEMRNLDGAIGCLEHYYAHEAKEGWQKTLRTIWEESGKATIAFMEAYHTGKSYQVSEYDITSREDYDHTEPQRIFMPIFRQPDPAIENSWLQFVDDYLRDRAPGDVRITGINDTTKERIMDVIADGMSRGDGMPEIGKQVEEHLDETWLSRGETIARTETVGATNFASLEEAKAIAPTLLKNWTCTFATNDKGEYVSRQAHMDADEEYGANPIPQNEPFIVMGEEMDVPGDPAGSPENVINCECCVTYESPESPEEPAQESGT